MKIGEKIKLYRKKEKMTQKELAERIGVTASTVTKYEKNQLEPNLETIYKISSTLNINIFELISEKEAITGLSNLKTNELNNTTPDNIRDVKFLKPELLSSVRHIVDNKTYEDISILFSENQHEFHEKKNVIRTFKGICDYLQIDLSTTKNEHILKLLHSNAFKLMIIGILNDYVDDHDI